MAFEQEKLFVASFVGIIMLQGILCSGSEQALKYGFISEATSAPSVSRYDYIIIGGGTAGCPLAATLSSNATVLLLERGGSPYGNPNITNSSGFPIVVSESSPSSPSQRFLSEDGVLNARARVLGGGSCINGGFYSRADPHEISAAGWDVGLVNESYRWVEEVVAFEPAVKQWQSAVRDGLLEAGVGPDNGNTLDHLVGTKTGNTIFDSEGRRHTAADLLKYADPGRLTVLLHAAVHKILFTTKGQKRPQACGVSFHDATGIFHQAYLNIGPNTEIILSSGALGSPQLLMLSGIGPSDHLKTHNISIIVDQPLVGQGMADNPANSILIPSPRPVEESSAQVVGITEFGSYIEASSGLDYSSLFARNDIQIPNPMGATQGSPPLFSRSGFIFEKVRGPLSTGELRLMSRNLNENPSVTFNYFADPLDLRKCVEGLKVIESVIESKAFKPFKSDDISWSDLLNLTALVPVNVRPQHADVSRSLEQFCKDTVQTIYHYHGGCQVGKVVDSEYRVLGVDSLRVIDGSTFNNSPGTNPQATLMMLGRYMGVKILKERLEKD